MSVGVDHLETQLARAIGLTPELGDPRIDVAQCRIDLALINDFDVADTFVAAYQSLSPGSLPQLWFFDLLRGLHALLSYQSWFTGYQDAKLTHVTKRRTRNRIEAGLRRALAERGSSRRSVSKRLQ